MNRNEIDALVRAHRGRAHPVAFFHVLRQHALSKDDQAFLFEHAKVLTIHDLLTWRSRCDEGFTGAVIRRLAEIAADDPQRFDHEVLRAPRVSLAREEWIEIGDLVRGKVPDAVASRLAERGRGERLKEPSPAALAPQEEGDFIALLAGALNEGASAPPLPAPAIPAEEAEETIVERARMAWSSEERAMLLDWLARRGHPRKTLFDVALTAVRAGSIDPTLIAWMAGQLGTRAAWEAHGIDVFLAFIDRGAFAELEDMLAQTWSLASRPEPDKGPSGARRLLEAMHAGFAAALVQATREALSANDTDKACAVLSALACLDPPSRLSRSIHDLKRAVDTEGDALTLIELNARLVKHARAREATFESVIAALQGLADARLGAA